MLIVERTCTWCTQKTQGEEAATCARCGAPLAPAPLPWIDDIELPPPFGDAPPPPPRQIQPFPEWRSVGAGLFALLVTTLLCGFTIVIPVALLVVGVRGQKRRALANRVFRDGVAVQGVVTLTPTAPKRSQRRAMHFAYTSADGQERSAFYATTDPRAAALVPGTPIWVVYDRGSPDDAVPWPPMQPA